MKCPLIQHILVIVVTTLMFTTSSCPLNFYPKTADGDGLTQANMVASQDENKKATLFVGISPLLLNNRTVDNFIIKLELYNIANQSRYPNATYHVSIIKNEYAPNEKDRNYLDGTFITRNGFLTLYVNNSEKKEPRVSQKEGSTYPLIFHTDKNDSVNLTVPFQLHSGQYYIHSEVSIPDNHSLSFGSILQIGEIQSRYLVFNQHIYNIRIISYYDKIKDFSFNTDRKTFTWEVPFEYNSTRIDDGKVKVHEEIIVPNDLLKVLHMKTFNLTMNNQSFDEALFSVDPYTFANKTIIHYVPKDNALFEITNGDGIEKANWLMKFVLFVK